MADSGAQEPAMALSSTRSRRDMDQGQHVDAELRSVERRSDVLAALERALSIASGWGGMA
jgi:hypothetical protein